MTGKPVIICPNRLYGNNFEVIRRIAQDCFGSRAELIADDVAESRRRSSGLTGNEVVVYGQGFSGEIGIRAPTADEGVEGSFKIDFLLTRVDEALKPISFVAVEVQTIDTTDSYSEASKAYYAATEIDASPGLIETRAGFNWENVSKRILPQLIYKGHALRREANAQFGLYFVLPHAVFEKIKTRIGGRLLEYPRGPGTITFHSYELGEAIPNGPREILLQETFTTTVEQIAFAFVSPQNLPPLGVYEKALADKLGSLRNRRRLVGKSEEYEDLSLFS